MDLQLFMIDFKQFSIYSAFIKVNVDFIFEKSPANNALKSYKSILCLIYTQIFITIDA